ncbi:MAG: hypothetical protein Q4C05_04385 [Akkermansia sp.]|nr:hypothetical protein [Akkermansia sp.]
MKATYILSLCAVAITLGATSCTNFTNASTYNRNELGSTQSVVYGTVTAIESARVQSSTTGAGAAVGAVAGGLTGAVMGGGSAKYATAAGGTIIGAGIGSFLDQQFNQGAAQVITVQLDKGKQVKGSNKIAVVQGVDPSNPISIGQRVRVLVGARASRVLAY